MEEREKLFKIVEAAYKNTGHALMEFATGTGKSLAAIRLISERADEKWVILVSKLVHIDNWKDEFKKWKKEHLLDKVEFITYASVEAYAESGKRKNVIADESHNINERRYIAIRDLLNINPYNLIGKGRGHFIALSATIDNERRPMLHRLGISHQNTIKFSLDSSVEADIIADYKLLVVHVPLEANAKAYHRLNKWKNIYCTEEDMYHTLTAKYQQVLQAGGDTKFATLDRMHFIYNLPSKTQAALTILQQLSKERKVLTFGSSITQIEGLCEHTHHSKKGKKDTCFQDFKDSKIMSLGAVTTIAEGVNIPALDTGFVVQAMSKSLHMVQRTGRLLRKDTEKVATVIVLSLDETQDSRWVQNALKDFDKSKVSHTTIKEVRQQGIENILSTL